MKVKSESEVAQSCLTLRDPMDCSLPGSSVHGILQARTLEWVTTPSNKKTFFQVGFDLNLLPLTSHQFMGFLSASEYLISKMFKSKTTAYLAKVKKLTDLNKLVLFRLIFQIFA